ncbi:hypothetical protein [Oceanisphaera sp.]|uniref:hypothetical protein n=1 Tax=Oceanisphaera sp. TaxID=1929979 RepID=UPI003A93668B
MLGVESSGLSGCKPMFDVLVLPGSAWLFSVAFFVVKITTNGGFEHVFAINQGLTLLPEPNPLWGRRLKAHAPGQDTLFEAPPSGWLPSWLISVKLRASFHRVYGVGFGAVG